MFLEGSKSNLLALKTILGDYEMASGQKVNLQISSIFFGKGSTEDTKEQLKAVIGITSEALGEKYLGLPTPDGRMTKGKFQNLQVKITKRLFSYDGHPTQACKEVLFKSVTQ